MGSRIEFERYLADNGLTDIERSSKNKRKMTHKIISLALFAVIVFSFMPVYRAEAVWREEEIRSLCREEIAKQLEPQPTFSYGNPSDSLMLEGRITNLETKMSVMEQIVRAIFGLVVKMMETLSKLAQ